ncbi:MAG: sigma-54 dependent transcriptional regulator [Mariprofundales bacterium]
MRVLVVDDDIGIRWVLSRVLREEQVEVLEAQSIAEAKEYLRLDNIDLVFLDVYLPDGNGMLLLQEGIDGKDITTPVVLLTAETTFDHAAQAYRAGALEYLPKPFDLDEVRELLHRIQRLNEDTNILNHDNELHATNTNNTNNTNNIKKSKQTKTHIIGRAPAMQKLFRTLGRVASLDLSVLITGESGTGKDLVARLLHEQSKHVNANFIAINTAAIPAELLESELFGYERGAFTGADRRKIGRFEQADNGTLFLDEIGDMPMALQVKLLRVLEERAVQRVGGRESIPVRVRLLTATHQNLHEKIKDGKFREDLFHRLNVIPVHIPPLRDRSEDIAELSKYQLANAAQELECSLPVLLDDALDLLAEYHWPGNVRELKNVMWRLAALTPGASITRSDVSLALGGQYMQRDDETLAEASMRCMRQYLQQLGYASVKNLHDHALAQVEPALLRLSLEKTQGNQLKAADMLGINRNTVRKLLRKYDIDANDFKTPN